MVEHYTQLLEWRRAEGATRGLAKLPPDFYPVTRAYLDDVRRTFENELRENPAGRKGDLARQTHQRAVQISRDIIEARMTKLLSLAFQASAGGARDLTHALPEERKLFDSLLMLLRGHRVDAAPYLESGAGAAGAPAPATPTTVPVTPAKTLPERGPSPPPSAVVRVLKDGRPIEVGTETIDLGKEDVIALPPEIARLLVGAKAVELILPTPTRSIT